MDRCETCGRSIRGKCRMLTQNDQGGQRWLCEPCYGAWVDQRADFATKQRLTVGHVKELERATRLGLSDWLVLVVGVMVAILMVSWISF